MVRSLPRILSGGDPPGTPGPCAHEQVLEISWDLPARSQSFRLAVPRHEISLADVVPLARRMSSILMCQLLDEQKQLGQPVTCRKGCSACCHYLVPLAVPEALRLGAEIDRLPPAHRHRIGQGFSRQAEDMLELADRRDRPDRAILEEEGNDLVIDLYSLRRVPCVMLDADLCSEYEIRPVCCREHITAGPAVACAGPTGGREVALPLSLFYVLSEITCRLLCRPFEQVYLPLLPTWYRRFGHLARRTWPAEVVIREMTDSIGRLAQRAGAA